MRGIIALFTTGILFNPMVLLGIIFGIIIMSTLDNDSIHKLFTSYHFYGLLLIISAICACTFKREYFSGGSRTNWKATLYGIPGQFFTLLAAIIFSCLFIFSFTFGEDDDQLTEKLTSQPEIKIDLQS